MRPSGEIPDEQQSFRTITRESGSRGSYLEPAITMALDDLKDINETFDADCETFMKEVQEIRNHLNNATIESQVLHSKLIHSFERLKNMFLSYDGTVFSMAADTLSWIDERRIEQWELEEKIERKERKRKEKERKERKKKENKRKLPTAVDPLRMIRRKLEDLGENTKEKTDEMLKELAQLKSAAQLQHVCLKSENEGLHKNFLKIEELIQRCCTIKKIPFWQQFESD